MRRMCGAPHRQQYTVTCGPVEQSLKKAGGLCSSPQLPDFSRMNSFIPQRYSSLSQCSPTRPPAASYAILCPFMFQIHLAPSMWMLLQGSSSGVAISAKEIHAQDIRLYNVQVSAEAP